MYKGESWISHLIENLDDTVGGVSVKHAEKGFLANSNLQLSSGVIEGLDVMPATPSRGAPATPAILKVKVGGEWYHIDTYDRDSKTIYVRGKGLSRGVVRKGKKSRKRKSRVKRRKVGRKTKNRRKRRTKGRS